MNHSLIRPFLLFTALICGLAAGHATAQVESVAKATETPASSEIVQPAVAIRRVDRGNVSPLTRVGVQTAQPIPLTLHDAIRRALENNNDIEVSRGDVRFQETQVRSLLGVYDPLFTMQPNFSRNS